jgi:diguanylate cyclase (GGDEF)-like protein/PAS domain S-box-containing protein
MNPQAGLDARVAGDHPGTRSGGWRAAFAALRGHRADADVGWVGDAMRRTTPELAVYVFQGEATRADDLVVTHRGPGRDRLLGGKSTGAGATDWAHAVHPEDRAKHRRAESYAQLRKGKPIDVKFRLIGVDGQERWMDEHLVPRSEGGRLLVAGIVVNVTSQRRMRIEAEQTRRRLETVMRRADTYVWVSEVAADGTTRDIYSVSGIERLVGGSLAADEDPQVAWRNVVHPDDLAAFDASLEAAAQGESFDLEYRMVGHDGVTRLVRDQAAVTLLGGGRFRIEGLVQDVTAEHAQRRALAVALATAEGAKRAAEDHARQLIEAQAELERIGRLDSLTGLTNRRHATEVIEQALASGASVGIAMLDVDRFKRVNDTHGHAAGDQVLIEVGRRLEAIRDEDLIARWGGEEFCVLLTDITDEVSLEAAAERLRRAVAARPFTLADGTRLEMTVSVGVSRSSRRDTEVDRLVGAADAALYRAKHGGRNQVRSAAELSASRRATDRLAQKVPARAA